MRKGLTEVVFILDRSGSMRGLEADTIGGFNSMIEKQRSFVPAIEKACILQKRMGLGLSHFRLFLPEDLAIPKKKECELQ